MSNRVDPSLVSPIAVAISKFLPSSTDPCGKITYSIPSDSNNNQAVARFDYHIGASQSVFVRYLDTTEHFLSPLEKTGNPLTVIPATVPSVSASMQWRSVTRWSWDPIRSTRFTRHS